MEKIGLRIVPIPSPPTHEENLPYMPLAMDGNGFHLLH